MEMNGEPLTDLVQILMFEQVSNGEHIVSICDNVMYTSIAEEVGLYYNNVTYERGIMDKRGIEDIKYPVSEVTFQYLSVIQSELLYNQLEGTKNIRPDEMVGIIKVLGTLRLPTLRTLHSLLAPSEDYSLKLGLIAGLSKRAIESKYSSIQDFKDKLRAVVPDDIINAL